jgi:hypothetical protein
VNPELTVFGSRRAHLPCASALFMDEKGSH